MFVIIYIAVWVCAQKVKACPPAWMGEKFVSAHCSWTDMVFIRETFYEVPGSSKETHHVVVYYYI